MIYCRLVLISLLFSTAVAAQTSVVEWNGITLLKSTKADVEKVLGAKNKDTSLYETKNEKIFVWYNSGKCKNKFPLGVVVGILVAPKIPLKPAVVVEKSGLGFDKEPDWKVKGAFHYLSRNTTIEIGTRTLPDGSENVVSILYRPPVKICE